MHGHACCDAHAATFTTPIQLPCCVCRDARVMWDHNTGRSKGYGFVSFRRKEEAEAAIDLMQAKQIGSRRIRVGWAQHKQVRRV